MRISTEDLKDECWESNVYWKDDNFVVETKKGTYTLKKAYPTSVKFSLDHDNGLGPQSEEYTFVGNDKRWEKFVKGQ